MSTKNQPKTETEQAEGSNLLAVQNENSLLPILAEAEDRNDEDFKPVGDGVFKEFAEGEQITAIFTGFESVKKFDGAEGEMVEAAVFHTSDGVKNLNTATVLVNKLRNVLISDNTGGTIVRISYLGKVKSPTSKMSYHDFKVGSL